MYALANEGGIRKDMLLGRWGANAMIGGMTHIVLTFPVPDSAPMVRSQLGDRRNRELLDIFHDAGPRP